jgi:hypothetical protein
MLETIFIQPMRALVDNPAHGLVAYFIYEADGITQHSHEFHQNPGAPLSQLQAEFRSWAAELYRELVQHGHTRAGDQFAFLVYMPKIVQAQHLADEADTTLRKLGYPPALSFALDRREWTQQDPTDA